MLFSKTQMRFFDKAASIARTGTFEKYQLGCIAVLKNRIIAAAPNQLKTHPLQAKFDKYRNFNNIKSDTLNMHSLHAEIACLSSIKNDIDFNNIELYTVRLLRRGGFGLARPCAACFEYIKSLGIKKIYYSTNCGFVYEQLC